MHYPRNKECEGKKGRPGKKEKRKKREEKRNYDMYTPIQKRLPKPGETAVIFATLARIGEIKCPVNYK